MKKNENNKVTIEQLEDIWVSLEDFLKDEDDEKTEPKMPQNFIDGIEMANWAVNKLKMSKNNLDFYNESTDIEINRLKEECKKEIEKLEHFKAQEKQSYDFKTSFLFRALDFYSQREDVPTTTTKTQQKLVLATGNFIKKFPKVEHLPSDSIDAPKKSSKLLEYCKEHNQNIEVSETVNWKEFKKCIKYTDVDLEIEMVNPDTGELKTINIPKDSIYNDETKEVLDFMTTKKGEYSYDIKERKQNKKQQ